MIVVNPNHPRAAVNGTFIFQRKGIKNEWMNSETIPLSSLKKGKGFKLEIASVEVLALFDGLMDLYELHQKEGIPRLNTEYVKVNRKLAQLAALSDSQFRREAYKTNGSPTIRHFWNSRRF
jgi:hypothetical protein